MKKIIFFSKNLNIGGMEKSLVLLLNSLSNEFDITLILEEKKGHLLNQLNKKIVVDEYKLSNDKLIIFRKIKNFIRRLIWNFNNKNKYDFSCCYATYSVIGSRLAAVSSKNNSLYVHSDYYDVFNGDRSRIIQFFSKLKIEKFKYIIFVSNESKKKLEITYPNIRNKFIVINNLIDYENIKKMSKINYSDLELFYKDKTNFLFVGRLDNTSKNIVLLIESFKLAIDKNKNIQLFIIGDGSDYFNIRNLIKKYDIDKNVFMLGEKVNPYPYILNSDCIVLTSNYEGFPVVYLEAIVLNKRIMSTIIVSDESINLKKYIINLNKNKISISNNILKYKKSSINYKINYQNFNDNKINKIKELICCDD